MSAAICLLFCLIFRSALSLSLLLFLLGEKMQFPELNLPPQRIFVTMEETTKKREAGCGRGRMIEAARLRDVIIIDMIVQLQPAKKRGTTNNSKSYLPPLGQIMIDDGLLCLLLTYLFYTGGVDAPSTAASCRREDEARDGASTLFGCCSPRESGRLRAVCRRRLGAADQGECLPCPGSSA